LTHPGRAQVPPSSPPGEAVKAAADPIWGERPGLIQRSSIALELWRADLTDHGLEHITYDGVPAVPRIFFAVRDLSWATPPVPLSYQLRPAVGEPHALAGADFQGRVDGYPLQVSGSVELDAGALTVTFVLEVGEDVEVSRAGPCVLLEVPRPGEPVVTDLPGPDGVFIMGHDILAHPLVSGYRRLSVPAASGKLTIEFSGSLFEMEDQRNWADNTLKSYCPPLSVPRPIRLRGGEPLSFAVRLTTEGVAATRGEAVPGAQSGPAPVALSRTGTTYPLPAIGLTHPGGPLAAPVVELLEQIRPAFLHLLVELGRDDWAASLEDEVRLARRLGSDVVVTVDCPPGARPELAAVAAMGGGSISTAFLFGSGRAVTSEMLADEGRKRLEGTGVKVGAGSRGHFASVNAQGRVPEAAEVICVALAGAAHDEDRRALTSGLGSYKDILRQLRRLAGDRDILVGPVGFAPTFDSWSPPGEQAGPREAWRWAHRRQATVFGAAWTVASIAALVPLGPTRICLATGDVGAAGALEVDARSTYPHLSGLGLLAHLGGGPVGVAAAAERIAGLCGSDATILALMADDPVPLSAISSRVTVWSGSPFGPHELDAAAEDVASPSIVVFGERSDLFASTGRN
jgi:hypothetical protein